MIFEIFLVLVSFSNICWCACVEAKQKSDVCCPELDYCFTKVKDYGVRAPRCPSGKYEISYQLWTRSHDQVPTIMRLDNITVTDFRKVGKIYFIVSGWRNLVDEEWINNLRKELLKKEDVNIIIVNWEKLASFELFQSSSNTRSAATHVAKVLNKIKASKNVTYTWCLGFSLGAHVCGQVGKKTHLNRITALDPARPFFDSKTTSELALNDESADFVDIIHSSSTSGYRSPLGDADFFVNRGSVQPQCNFFDFVCNHNAANLYMLSSIMHNCFRAQKCTDFEKIPSSCINSTVFARMGYNASPKYTGVFYLKTRPTFPYCA